MSRQRRDCHRYVWFSLDDVDGGADGFRHRVAASTIIYFVTVWMVRCDQQTTHQTVDERHGRHWSVKYAVTVEELLGEHGQHGGPGSPGGGRGRQLWAEVDMGDCLAAQRITEGFFDGVTINL